MSSLRNKISIVSSIINAHIKNLKNIINPVETCENNYVIFQNFEGEKITNYYLCDSNFRFDYSSTKGRIPRNIFWDRTRYNLPYHFYVDEMMFLHYGNPKKKYGILLEPETIRPKLYDTILKNKSTFESEFECIFTHSDTMLNSLRNAMPLIVGGVYIGTDFGGGTIDENKYLTKSKNVSIVSSDKEKCELHRFRLAIANKYNSSGLVDCFGTFNGKFIKIAESLENYRYSFAIENCINDYWITERICNCFASMTIPIYLGSPKIKEFFNIEGIIIIERQDLEYIDAILKRCTKEYYENHINAVIDNFHRVQKYLCMEDWLYTTYKNILP